jgi:predicted RND superfamily exporter protein
LACSLVYCANGFKLLYGVLLSLPFIGIRLIYGFLALLLTNQTFAQSLAAKVVLGLIPEFLTVAIFVVAGIVTRDMWREEVKEPKPESVVFGEVSYSYPGYRAHGDHGKHYRTVRSLRSAATSPRTS